MSQRIFGYIRIPDERYETIETWPVALLSQLPDIGWAWDPADDGSRYLIATLHRKGINAVGSGPDFLSTAEPPMAGVTDIITNPPLGVQRRGELAVAFVEHALRPPVQRISMLLRSTSTARSADNTCSDFAPPFTGKIVLQEVDR